MWWLASWAMAQDVPVPEGKVAAEPRRTFDTKEYEALEQFRALYDQSSQQQQAEIEALRKQLEQRALQQGLVTEQQLAAAAAAGGAAGAPPGSGSAPSPSAAAGTSPAPPATLQGGNTPPGPPAQTERSRPSPSGTAPSGRSGASGPAGPPPAPPAHSLGQPLVFSVPDSSVQSTTTVVPAGTYVKVRILTGVEATARDDLPMLVQADHAMVGPNRRKIDLRGCFFVLQVKGEMSTDRVVGKAVTLSCVREDGEHVHRTVNGYLAGEDSTFGVTGQLISRQGRVVAAATVASLAQAAGEAVATAQEARQLIANPLGGAATEVTNVEGNQAAYIAGSAGASGAGLIANWYLKYADQLLPAIAVGSGRDVWVVLLDSVEVPPLAVP